MAPKRTAAHPNIAQLHSYPRSQHTVRPLDRSAHTLRHLDRSAHTLRHLARSAAEWRDPRISPLSWSPRPLSCYVEMESMPRSGPTTLTLPPFEGTVRQLVLINIGVYFGLAVLGLLLPDFTQALVSHLVLQPAALVSWPWQPWQIVTYSFIHLGIMDILFSMLMVWMFGSMLEGSYGARFMREVYFTSAIGGALLAAAASFTHLLGLRPDSVASGAGSALFGVMVALAMRMGDLEIFLWFVVRIRIKYLVGIYVLIDLAVLLRAANAFGALLHLSAGLCSFLYVNYAPRKGLAFSFSEQYFGLRNSYYRYKRRRAARKFEVYMGKQGRKVYFDEEGRYLDPDKQKDPNDKRWMN